MGKLHIGICGDQGLWNEYNPFKVTRGIVAKNLLCLLNRKPLSLVEICKALRKETFKIEDSMNLLLKINAIRQENKKYWINFAIFSEKDRLLLADIGRRYGKQLAFNIEEHKTELYDLSTKLHCAKRVAIEKILFALIGYYALDIRCLEELERLGFLTWRKKQPGNREYILLGSEYTGTPKKFRGLSSYCNGNSEREGKYVFTSFGDYMPRICFPDILWNFRSIIEEHAEGDKDFREVFANILYSYSKKVLSDAGKIIEALAKCKPIKDSKNQALLLRFLEKLGYLSWKNDNYVLNVPVFLPKEETIINEIAKKVSCIATEFISENHTEIARTLKDTRPMKNKIPLEEFFVAIWHWIFGYCNGFLAKRGVIYDPPEDLNQTRYLQWLCIVEGETRNSI
ncbi:MAG: hypothetical protein AB1779_03180 [Candidatus Thermoplasmatota archaeon]